MADYSIEPIADGWYLVRQGNRQWRVAVADAPDSTWYFAGGVAGTLEAVSGPERRSRRGRGDTGVMAPMPATVVAVQTAVGQAVSQGDTLLVLEAMKMELPIRAPRDGVVRAVACAEGDLVQPGVNLVEFE